MAENDFNTLTHYLVPEHELLSQEEADKVLADLKITRDQLPKMKSSDAALQVLEKVLGYKIPEGSIIKVTRNSKTAEVFVAYRLVTE